MSYTNRLLFSLLLWAGISIQCSAQPFNKVAIESTTPSIHLEAVVGIQSPTKSMTFRVARTSKILQVWLALLPSNMIATPGSQFLMAWGWKIQRGITTYKSPLSDEVACIPKWEGLAVAEYRPTVFTKDHVFSKKSIPVWLSCIGLAKTRTTASSVLAVSDGFGVNATHFGEVQISSKFPETRVIKIKNVFQRPVWIRTSWRYTQRIRGKKVLLRTTPQFNFKYPKSKGIAKLLLLKPGEVFNILVDFNPAETGFFEGTIGIKWQKNRWINTKLSDTGWIYAYITGKGVTE